MKILYDDIDYVNMGNEINTCTTREFENYNFQCIFFNWNISVIYGAKFTRFGTLLVECHSEGTLSQIFYLGLRFDFMKSRKLSYEKG